MMDFPPCLEESLDSRGSMDGLINSIKSTEAGGINKPTSGNLLLRDPGQVYSLVLSYLLVLFLGVLQAGVAAFDEPWTADHAVSY